MSVMTLIAETRRPHPKDPLGQVAGSRPCPPIGLVPNVNPEIFNLAVPQKHHFIVYPPLNTKNIFYHQ